jgi:hypothetical protein
MDERRFDALARAIGKSGSRRSLMKGLLGIGGTVVAGRFASDVEAARRPTPTPKPPSCPGNQVPCSDGCCCPDGSTRCGPACCPIGQAECCDNACCYGRCLGEEVCCTAEFVCGDACCSSTERCCLARETPVCLPADAPCSPTRSVFITFTESALPNRCLAHVNLVGWAANSTYVADAYYASSSGTFGPYASIVPTDGSGAGSVASIPVRIGDAIWATVEGVTSDQTPTAC